MTNQWSCKMYNENQWTTLRRSRRTRATVSGVWGL